MANAQWMDILNRVKSGELSIDEAARRLETLEAANEPDVISPKFVRQPAADPEVERLDLGWWENAWLVPLWIGIGIVVLSAVLLSWGYANERFFWFYCSWLPLLLGMFILIIGVWSRQSRWVHVRIREAGGTRISISMPLPVRFAGWVMRWLTPLIPALQQKNLESVPVLLDALGNNREPITVDINEKDGDQVRVYIL